MTVHFYLMTIRQTKAKVIKYKKTESRDKIEYKLIAVADM